MSYDKTTWAKGDVVTAAKLNNMENGIEAIDTAQAAVFSPDISEPQDGDTLVYYSDIQGWENRHPTENDYVITCTVTGADFSGTTDATRQQITDAYNDHKNIIIKTSYNGIDSYVKPSCYNVIGTGDNAYVQVTWITTYMIGTSYFLVNGYTNVTTASTATYSCNMFTLTPYTPS